MNSQNEMKVNQVTLAAAFNETLTNNHQLPVANYALPTELSVQHIRLGFKVRSIYAVASMHTCVSACVCVYIRVCVSCTKSNVYMYALI